MSTPPIPAREAVRPLVPKMVEVTEQVIYGDIWERPGLGKRDRSLATLSMLISCGRSEQLPLHLERALANGVTRDEISELITHLAFYVGWPAAMTAATVATEVLRGKGLL